MKNSHAPLAPLLLLASLLAPGRAAGKPANFPDPAPRPAEELNAAARESEWSIIITVDAERRIFFRKEQVGTSDDVGPLKERVRKAIERNRRAARDQGDEGLAKGGGAVLICASPDLKYRDVVKVIDAIKEAGGDPVGLDTDCAPPRQKPTR